MEFERYLDLYIAETEEHLQTLNRGLLELEAGRRGEPLDAAFRAAHTIKGVSAMMGFDHVAELAHALEDRLDEIRAGRLDVDAELIDVLLAEVDALTAAIERAIAEGGESGAGEAGDAADVAVDAGGAPDAAEDDASPQVTVPEGTAVAIRVVLDAECALPAARAALVVKNLQALVPVLGTAPAEYWELVGREVWVFAGEEADGLEAAIRAAGEVATVEFLGPETFELILPAIVAAAAEVAPSPAPDEDGAVRDGDEGAAFDDDAAGPQAVASAGVSRTGPQGGEDDGGTTSGAQAQRFMRVDRRLLGELTDHINDIVVLSRTLQHRASESGNELLARMADRLVLRMREVSDLVLQLRLVPASEVFDRLPRVVRDASRALGKEVDFRVEGRDVELDRDVLEELVDPLVHLLRNAIDHGLESRAEREAAGKPARGRLELVVVRERSSVRIEVRDDGRGIAREKVIERARALGIEVPDGEVTDEVVLRLLSHPGLTTAQQVSGVSGRGVGMDAVVNRIRALGGAVGLQTSPGVGTTFSLRLPITLSLMQALRIRVADEEYAIPVTHVAEAVDLTRERVEARDTGEVVLLRGRTVPLVRLRTVLGLEGAGAETAAVVAELGERRAALAVDELVGREQIVVEGFDAAAGTLPIFSGAALLADGRPALVLDPISVL